MPVKFDDIPKVATEVLNDDHQTAGFVLKAKQKASYGASVLSTQVDLFQKGSDCSTPAKLTWKWPTPLGCKYFNIDKFELDKGGKFKLEASSDKMHDGLKCELKSDLADPSKIALGYTYTGFKDTQLKLDSKALKPQDFTGEVTHTRGIVTGGAKFTSKGGAPDMGIRMLSGPFFCALLAKDKFSTYNASVFYKANPDVKLAATYQHGGKANGSCTLGLAYKGLAKVKVTQDQVVSCSVKHSLAKGFTLLGGMSFNVKKGSQTYGLQLSIE
jgi:hypothetical protein